MFTLSGKGAKPQVLTTINFPTGSISWTVPAGVTKATFTGRGGNGVSDASTSFWFAYGRVIAGTGGSSTLNWSTVYSTISGLIGGAGNRFVNALSSSWFFTSATGLTISQFSNIQLFTTSTGTTYVSGALTATTEGGAVTSGTVAGLGYWKLNGTYWAQGYAGNATTIGSFSFPGGSYSGSYPNGIGGSASPTTYTNQTVTPGATLTGYNYSGASLIVTYYA